MNKMNRPFTLSILIALVLASCNINTPDPNQDPDIAFTAAALTVQALVTMQAPPPPTGTPPIPTSMACPVPVGWDAIIVDTTDTIDSIANKYKITPEALSASNCLITQSLTAGSILYVPFPPTVTVMACPAPAGWDAITVGATDTIDSIANKYKITPEALSAGNCLITQSLTAGSILYVPSVPDTLTLTTGDYDFVAHAAEATWSSGAGALTLSAADATTGPLALKLDKPLFEDGKDTYGAGLLFFPNNTAKGFVKAVYTPYLVQSGDRFQARIGCQSRATTCYVSFQLWYQIDGTSQEFLLWRNDPKYPFRERYEGLTYPVNVSLNALAGKNVRFILLVTDWDGSPAGDRALWGNPRITRSGGGTPPPANCTDRAQFIGDVDSPDGRTFVPNMPFTKTWQIKNIGTCTWTSAYQLLFVSGNKMGGSDSISFETASDLKPVAPGQIMRISVALTTPGTPGFYYTGYWKFKNDKGVPFGVVRFGNPNQAESQTLIWVTIRVVQPRP